MAFSGHKFLISEEITRIFPELRVGVLVGEGLSIEHECQELENLKKEVEAHIISLKERCELPQAINLWMDAYRRMGVSPKKHVPTLVAMFNRVAKGKPIPTINTLVDSYLIVELRYLIPAGGYDLAKIEGNIHLRTSSGNEEFIPLGSTEKELTRPGEIVYSDEKKVLTRFLNYKDSELTKIEACTKDVVLMMESLSNEDRLEEALEELSKLIKRFCGGSTSTFIAEVGGGPWEL